MSPPRKSGFEAALALTLKGKALSLFIPLLQRGVQVGAMLPCTIQSFLCDQLGLPADYVHERILSIVLDGHPVDDPKAAHLQDGSQLALSSGMPGLAGATLRRGSPLASFRGLITHRDSALPDTIHEGILCLKLFNLMMGDLGPPVLERGIRIRREALVQLLLQQRDVFLETCREVRRNNVSLDPARFMEEMAANGGEEALPLTVWLEPSGA